jgi:CRISPR-associated protein Csx3
MVSVASWRAQRNNADQGTMLGAALAYCHHPWLGIVQAQQYDECIVVMSRDAAYQPGACFRFRTDPHHGTTIGSMTQER